MSATNKIKIEDYVKVFQHYSIVEQAKIVKKITDIFSSNVTKKEIDEIAEASSDNLNESKETKGRTKIEKERRPLLVPSPKIPVDELLGEYKNGIPKMKNKEAHRKKYAVTKEQLEPLIELFKDAPSAEDLIKML